LFREQPFSRWQPFIVFGLLFPAGARPDFNNQFINRFSLALEAAGLAIIFAA
jgi:hypothetical protein